MTSEAKTPSSKTRGIFNGSLVNFICRRTKKKKQEILRWKKNQNLRFSFFVNVITMTSHERVTKTIYRPFGNLFLAVLFSLGIIFIARHRRNLFDKKIFNEVKTEIQVNSRANEGTAYFFVLSSFAMRYLKKKKSTIGIARNPADKKSRNFFPFEKKNPPIRDGKKLSHFE